MLAVAADRAGAVRGVDEEFLELMCADEDLLRAEFDAIIAREWSGTPPPADLPAASSGTGHGPRRHRLRRGAVASPRPEHPGADGWSRQRSPPRLTRNQGQKPNKWMDEGR